MARAKTHTKPKWHARIEHSETGVTDKHDSGKHDSGINNHKAHRAGQNTRKNTY